MRLSGISSEPRRPFLGEQSERDDMDREYLAPAPSGLRRALGRFLALGGDYRTPEAHAAFRAAIAEQPPRARRESPR